MNASEKAIRNRAGTDPRFDALLRRQMPERDGVGNQPAPLSPPDAGISVPRDFYAVPMTTEAVTLGGLAKDYTKAGLNVGYGLFKLIPFVGNFLNGFEAVGDAFKLAGSATSNGLFSQSTFKAAMDLTAHATGTIPGFEAIGAFYDQSKALADFFDAGRNTVNYFRDAPRVKMSEAHRTLMGALGGVVFAPPLAAFMAPGGVAAAQIAAHESGLLASAALQPAIGAFLQKIFHSSAEKRQLPRALPLTA